MSDRFEIQDILAKYCGAIDSRNWNVLDDIFTPDAIIDYTAAGGACGNLQDIKLYLDKALRQFSGMQHMLGLPVINIDGDMATARTTLFNPMIINRGGLEHVVFGGLWYCDDLIRTHKGWRINNRREELSYFHNVPDDFISDES